jgi:cell pole-organizing protein PopZ
MSDAVNEVESLDVMSSVRRKVSTGKTNGRNGSAGVDKLVLTASLRVDGSTASTANTEQPVLAEVTDSVEAANDQPNHEDDTTAEAQMSTPEADPEIVDADLPTDDSPVDKDMAGEILDDTIADRDILTAEPAGFAPGMMMDEDTLRDMISDIVRQELQGDLGEKITRNVRKLVRREIHRTMVSNELS